MINSEMPHEKTWTKDGVTITYLPFDTIRTLKVARLVREAYLYAAPTADEPTRQEVEGGAFMFYSSMPFILSVSLADDHAAWGDYLKQQVDDPHFLDAPVTDYKRFEKFAPIDVILECYEGYQQTREKKLAAPPELQVAPPLPPEAYLMAGEDNEDALNFTESSMSAGTPSSNEKSSHALKNQSDVPLPIAT